MSLTQRLTLGTHFPPRRDPPIDIPPVPKHHLLIAHPQQQAEHAALALELARPTRESSLAEMLLPGVALGAVVALGIMFVIALLTPSP